MKRLTVFSLVLCTILLMFLGVSCSDGKKPSSLPEPGPDTDVEIEWFVNVSYWKWPGKYGEDYLSDLIKRRTGVTINFSVPAGDGNTQIMTMIASETLPDIVTCDNEIRYKMVKGGYLWAYDDLIEKYAPDFKEILAQIDDVYEWYREYDGKVYGLPNYPSSENYRKEGESLNPNMSGVLRTDLYNQIGRPDITTPDDFLDALERIKNEVQTYDGQKIIPLQLYEFTNYGNPSLQALRGYFSVPFEDAEGNYMRHCEEEFQMFRFLNEAYNRGLLTIENFSDSRELINEKVASGRVFSLFAAIQDFTASMASLYDYDNNAQYETFVMNNYDGTVPHLADTSGYGYQTTSITVQAERPDRCTELIEYLMSDQGQIEMLFGAKDETQYTIDENGYVVWTEGGNLWNAYASGDEEQIRYYTLGFNLLTDYLRTKDYYAPATDARSLATQEYYINQPLRQYTYNGKLGVLKGDSVKEEEIGYAKITNKIDMYWGTQITKIIMAENVTEARRLYDEALEREKELGGDVLEEYLNECFQRSKELLGVEYAWPENVK